METKTDIKQETEANPVETELQAISEELKEILLDIRIYIMEAQTPIPNDLVRESLREELEAERG
jgi:hypothetical protein